MRLAVTARIKSANIEFTRVLASTVRDQTLLLDHHPSYPPPSPTCPPPAHVRVRSLTSGLETSLGSIPSFCCFDNFNHTLELVSLHLFQYKTEGQINLKFTQRDLMRRGREGKEARRKAEAVKGNAQKKKSGLTFTCARLFCTASRRLGSKRSDMGIIPSQQNKQQVEGHTLLKTRRSLGVETHLGQF